MNTVPDQNFQPPYMSWATFEGILDQLKAGGLPDVIDRSVLVGKSGGDQSQFLRACRSFGLIDDENDQPTERMRNLVNAEDRSTLLGEILREAYAPVVALSTGATQAMLEDKFREYGIEGDTVRKAIAFYLNAAKQTDIELSPRFKSTRPGAGGRRTRRTKNKNNTGNSGGPAEQHTPPPPPLGNDLPEIVGALVAKLPKKGESWTADEAKWWIKMAEMAFPREYAYDDPSGGDADDT
jgi:hypothetical protein